MLAAGDISAAREAADELCQIVDVRDTPALRAAAGYALGGVLLAEGKPDAALGCCAVHGSSGRLSTAIRHCPCTGTHWLRLPRSG